MIEDIVTILWKEWKEIIHMRGSARSTVVMMMVPLLLLGIVFPLQFGRHWAESPVSLLLWGWIPLLLASAVVADSFAGERERHTLETLLASRLPDRAILFGKLLASVFYSLGLTFAIIMIGIVTLNIRYFGEGFIFFNTVYFAAGTAIGLLGTTLISAAGILVSLRARTVRQAQQALSFVVVILGMSPGLFFGIVPVHIRARIADALRAVDGTTACVAGLVLLALVDCVLVAAAMKRFTRDRLIGE